MAFDPETDFFFVSVASNVAYNVNNQPPAKLQAVLADADFYQARDRWGKQRPVWQILDDSLPQKNSTAFTAYWCPYNNNTLGYTILGTDADYMFTATMDGCTFGIGTISETGACIVGHANAQHLQTEDGDTSGMEANQKMSLRSGQFNKVNLVKKTTLFEPKHYRTFKTLKASASTFGVRKSGKWRFYAYRYLVHGGLDGPKQFKIIEKQSLK
jgi:hypothetical protein